MSIPIYGDKMLSILEKAFISGFNDGIFKRPQKYIYNTHNKTYMKLSTPIYLMFYREVGLREWKYCEEYIKGYEKGLEK